MRFAGPVAALGIAAAVLGTLASSGQAHAGGTLTLATATQLPGADGGTEPRNTVTPDGKHYTISNQGGLAKVWESDDGLTNWHLTNSAGIAGQTSLATIDVDLVSMPAGSTHPGRLIANELDTTGLNIRTSYSDDGGATWTQSTLSGVTINGTQYVDQDRNWLATGPHDRVYFLFHNLASGAVTHNMFVATSTDGGASFGPPVPVTKPSDQAWTDLQCADSGGPSNIFVNQQTGRVYAVFGTRSSAAGGCGASGTGSFEINVVAATRVWVATAPESGTSSPASWTQSLAVDDNSSGKIVGMQLAPGAIDSANNLYVIYPESVAAYPNYDGAAVKYVHATEAAVAANPYGTGLPNPPANVWSDPVVVAPQGGAGHLLPHIVAGGPGQIDMAYFEGTEITNGNTSANWYLVAAQTTNALDAHPFIQHVLANYPGSPAIPLPAYAQETASQMMGACGLGPTNGFTCSRSTDVWGIALDNAGNLLVSWPSASPNSFGCAGTVDSPPCGTWVTRQIDGPTIAPGVLNANFPEAPFTALLVVAGAAAAAVGVRSMRRTRRVGAVGSS